MGILDIQKQLIDMWRLIMTLATTQNQVCKQLRMCYWSYHQNLFVQNPDCDIDNHLLTKWKGLRKFKKNVLIQTRDTIKKHVFVQPWSVTLNQEY